MKAQYLIIILLTIISCGKVTPKGSIENKEIPLEPFTSIDLKGKFRIFYVRGDSNFVAIESYPNVIKNLDIEVKNKKLSIIEKRETSKIDFYNITVYSKYNLDQVSISDSIEMNVSSALRADNFKLSLKNNAQFIGSINARKAELDMQNTSRANFEGFTTDAVIKISDTASLIAPYWKITNLDLDSKNGNYAEVNVKDTLKGKITNTAKLLYYNEPIKRFKADKTTKIENKVLN